MILVALSRTAYFETISLGYERRLQDSYADLIRELARGTGHDGRVLPILFGFASALDQLLQDVKGVCLGSCVLEAVEVLSLQAEVILECEVKDVLHKGPFDDEGVTVCEVAVIGTMRGISAYVITIRS